MNRSLQRIFCKFTRRLYLAQLPFIMRLHRLIRPFRTRSRQLGIFTASYNSSAYLPAHLRSIELTTVTNYDHFVAKNFTSPDESAFFDEVFSNKPEIKVFGALMSNYPCPLRHGESLQRMVAQTYNDIIVICDVDTLFFKKGWDEFVLDELKNKLVVGVLAYFGSRQLNTQYGLVLHPSFMAFRRSLLEDNNLDLLDGEGNDPAYKITKFLCSKGLFNEQHVSFIIPTNVEYPHSWFPADCNLGIAGRPSHGFCTHYSNYFMHFWHSMNFSEMRDIVADDGSILVKHEVVAERVRYYTSMFT